MEVSLFKTCLDCGATKQIGDFYTHGKMADGHLNKCKECVKLRMRLYRVLNPERQSQVDRKKHVKAINNGTFKRKNRRSPEQMRAHNAVQRHLRNHKPAMCAYCGVRQAECAHHPDYREPLRVIWLCTRCHMRLHNSKTISINL